jgi:hypothetical protein
VERTNGSTFGSRSWARREQAGGTCRYNTHRSHAQKLAAILVNIEGGGFSDRAIGEMYHITLLLMSILVSSC